MALKGKYSKVHGTALVPAVATYSEASDQVLQTQLAAKDFAKDRVTCSLLALRMSKDLNGLLHKASSYGAAPCRLRRVCCTKPSLSVDGLLLAVCTILLSKALRPSLAAGVPTCAAGYDLSAVSALHDRESRAHGPGN